MTDWQSFNVTKPTYVIEFTTNVINPVETGRQWLQQFDDGLIEFVDRVPKENTNTVTRKDYMLSDKVIQDFGHEITVLYYNNVHKRIQIHRR